MCVSVSAKIVLVDISFMWFARPLHPVIVCTVLSVLSPVLGVRSRSQLAEMIQKPKEHPLQHQNHLKAYNIKNIVFLMCAVYLSEFCPEMTELVQ